MAVVLRSGEPLYDRKFVIERPDGTRIAIVASIEPFKNAAGRVIGAVNCFYDITTAVAADSENLRLLARAVRENQPLGVADQTANRLAAIVESSEDAIISKDINGIVASWNAGAQRLFGYTAEEIIGRSITILIPDDHENEEPEILSRIRRGERVEHFETVRRRKDGSLIDLSLTISPVRDADGNIIGASKIARDISDRKRSEEALTKQAQEQAALYEFTASMHRAGSLDELYEAGLRALERALGCDRAALLLYDEFEVMRFVAWSEISDAYRNAVEGHCPWQPDVKDPQPYLVSNIALSDIPEPLSAVIRNEGIAALSFIPLVSNGRLVGKFMAYYDKPHAFADAELNLSLTIARQFAFGLERQRAEEELREKEERLRLATQAGKVGVWEWDAAKNRLNWTDALYPMHGIENQDFPGTIEGYYDLVHPDDRAEVHRRLKDAVEHNAPFELEFRIRKPNGRIGWLYTNAIAVRDHHGAPRVLGATLDITQRKESEAERDLLVAELSHRVKNTLATVISIAQQSFARGPSIEEARSSFAGRIRALAQTHSRLAEGNWSGVSFGAMLRDELLPYIREDSTNIRLSGPTIALPVKCAVVLGMAVHELVTNAAKYGALSEKAGVVSVAWEKTPENELHIVWQERGGPPVSSPNRSGFGSLLLERALASDLKGKVKMDFRREGLVCDIVLPLEGHAAN
jgi:PAS domain S-box-containing protein